MDVPSVVRWHDVVLLVVPQADDSPVCLPIEHKKQTVRTVERMLHSAGYSRAQARREAPQVMARGIQDGVL